MRVVGLPALGPRRVGLAGCLVVLSAGCSDVSPPDSYIGTIDPSGFDATVGGGTSWSCLVPRRGSAAAALDTRWLFLGVFAIPRGAAYPPQLDIANTTDATQTAPPAAYVISHTAPMGDTTFDPRTDNYLRSVQYPVLSNAAPEPTSIAAYKPWYVVVPVDVRADKRPRIGSNDIKSQRSIESRAGWDRDLKFYGAGAGLSSDDLIAQKLTPLTYPYGAVAPDGAWSQGRELQITTPSWDKIRTGQVTFKDWPMVNVSVPILTGQDTKLCPLTAGVTARYPMYPGDPAADFQFPQQAWVRGLLSGYLDGGDVAVTTTGCPGGLKLCPVVNTLYLSADDIMPIDKATMMRKAFDIATLATNPGWTAAFDTLPGEAGYAPVCKVKVYDPALSGCSAATCTRDKLKAAPAGAFLSVSDAYVHCLVSSGGRP